MSSVDPLLTGLAAAALTLVLIAIVSQVRRPLNRLRLRRKQRRYLRRRQISVTNEPTPRTESTTRTESTRTTEEVHRARAAGERSLPTLGVAIEHLDIEHPGEAQHAIVPAPVPVVGVAEGTAAELLQDAERRAGELLRAAEAEGQRLAEDARRRAAEELDAARLEARRIVDDADQERARLLGGVEHERALAEATHGKLRSLAAIEEATRTAETLLMVAEQRRVDLLSESEAAAERKAAEVAARARQQAQEMLEHAQAQAAGIIAAAQDERTRLVEELARERSVLEQTRTRLSGFLTDALEEVEAATETDGAPNVQNLDDARAVRTSGVHV
jgi:cell division septum initiation protein DivIVA